MADAEISLGLSAQELYGELQNVTAKFVKFAQDAQTSGEKAGKGFAGGFGGTADKIAAGLAGLGLGAKVKEVIEYGAHIQDLSNRFGVSTTSLQKFGNAAEKNGSSLESVAKGFRFLEVNSAKALSGNDAMVASFAALGVSLEDLKTKSPDDIMLQIGKSGLNAADVVKVLGKSALELRPILAGLADGTIEFGNAINAIDIARLKQADDEFKNINQNLKIQAATGISAFVTAWQQGINSIISAFQALFISVQFNISAIGKLMKGDFKGASKDIQEGLHEAGTRLHEGAETNREIAAGPDVQKPRDLSHAGIDTDSEAGETDDTGRSLGGGKAGKKAATYLERVREKVDEKAEEDRLAHLSPEERLADLKGKSAALLAESQAAYPELGTGEEAHKLELLEDYYDVEKKITEEEKKQSAEKERDDAARQKNEDILSAAKETTKQMELRAKGDDAGAKAAEIRAKYEKEIAAALDKKHPNEGLGEELKKQEGLALHEELVREYSKSPEQRQQEETQRREAQRLRNLAEARAKDEEDRRAHGSYTGSGADHPGLVSSGGLTTGHVQAGSLIGNRSDADFRAQFGQHLDINKLLSAQNKVKESTKALGKDGTADKHTSVAEKSLTTLEKIEKNTQDLTANK